MTAHAISPWLLDLSMLPIFALILTAHYLISTIAFFCVCAFSKFRPGGPVKMSMSSPNHNFAW